MNKPEDQFCSLLSAAAGESLIGSAGKTDAYFLLEYNRAWEDKAFEKSDIPNEVKQQLSSFSKSLPAAKVLVIKRGSHRRNEMIHFFVTTTDDRAPRLYRFELASYQELLDLDLAALLNGDKRYADKLQSEPLYLVCNNGRRDRCCARFGYPVYQALAERVGESAWECSHIGGHRFAPNFFHMPFGLLYGRVKLKDIEPFIERLQAGQIILENLRGRSAYPGPVQAAEYALRQRTGELGVMAYHLLDGLELQPGCWHARFAENRTDREYSLDVQVIKSEAKVFESCTLDKQTNIVEYIVSHSTPK